MRPRCVNIDWLEVYALESPTCFPCDADYFRAHGYFVRERDYGTRVYAEMFTIEDEHGYPFLEIRRSPFSLKGKDGGFFPRESCHIRVHNRTCYASNAISLLRDFMAKHDYKLRKIYRLDVCLDFTKFDRGDDPNKFLQRFMAGRYSKINQSRISAHGSDQWAGRVWNSVSWGNPKSMVSTKLYCKTLELQQAKDKPYIRQAWFLAGLIDDPITLTKKLPDGTVIKPDVWRVEFSVKSSANRWFVIDKATGKRGQVVVPHTLDMYDTPLKLLTVFASLASHYFRFKVYEADKRKDRCRDKVLFDFSPIDTFYAVDRLASHTSKSTTLDRLLSLLRNHRLTHPQPDIVQACDVLISALEREAVRDFLGYSASATDILLLQRLIADRMGRAHDKNIAAHMAELRNLIDDMPSLF